MELKDNQLTFYAETLYDWKNWLEINGETETVVWLIIYHKKSKIPSVSLDEANNVAICYGWVDSKASNRDAQSCYYKFTPRNPKSNWGKRNIERAERLMELGLMQEKGQKLIDFAKSRGKWRME